MQEMPTQCTESQTSITASDFNLASMRTGVDDAVGVPGCKWFAAIVNARHEKSVAEKLTAKGIHCYVATQPETRLWRDGRRKKIDRVVISSIVFIRCTEYDRRNIVMLPYINRFLVNRAATATTLNKPVAVIPDEEIRKLKFMLGQSETPVTFQTGAFRVKDNVRVIRGQFKGLEGQIMANSDGTRSLIVGLDFLGGAILRIDPTDIQKL